MDESKHIDKKTNDKKTMGINRGWILARDQDILGYKYAVFLPCLLNFLLFTTQHFTLQLYTSTQLQPQPHNDTTTQHHKFQPRHLQKCPPATTARLPWTLPPRPASRPMPYVLPPSPLPPFQLHRANMICNRTRTAITRSSSRLLRQPLPRTRTPSRAEEISRRSKDGFLRMPSLGMSEG